MRVEIDLIVQDSIDSRTNVEQIPASTTLDPRSPADHSPALVAPQRDRAAPRHRSRTMTALGNPWIQYVLVLAGLWVCYQAYHWTVSPLLEGGSPASKPPPLLTGQTLHQRLDRDAIFPPGSWQRELCKVLHTGQGHVLFQDYQPREDGSVEVWPLTLVLPPAQSSTAGNNATVQPALLHAKSATLRFDRPFSLGSRMGRLQSGQLNGQVIVIRQPPDARFAGDTQLPASSESSSSAFRLETQNVQLTPDRIFALEPVQFRIGSHQGFGRNLMIDLARESTESSLEKPSVRRVQLQNLEHLLLDRDPFQSSAENRIAQPSELPDRTPQIGAQAVGTVGNSEKFRVTCRGPLDFDFEQNSILLTDQVRVQSEARPDDQLNCVSLELFFSSGTETSSPLLEQSAKLQLTQAIALGAPARLDLGSKRTAAQANSIRYNASENMFSLSHGNVLLTQKNRSITSQSLRCQLSPDGGLAQAAAAGPGWLEVQSTSWQSENLSGTSPTQRPPAQFRIAWKQSMQVRPQGEFQVVSFLEQVDTVLGENQILSDEVHLWLVEQPASSQRSIAGDSELRVEPVRLVARGNVEIDGPQLAGSTQHIIADWVPSDRQPARINTDPRQTGNQEPARGQPLISTPAASGSFRKFRQRAATGKYPKAELSLR